MVSTSELIRQQGKIGKERILSVVYFMLWMEFAWNYLVRQSKGYGYGIALGYLLPYINTILCWMDIFWIVTCRWVWHCIEKYLWWTMNLIALQQFCWGFCLIRLYLYVCFFFARCQAFACTNHCLFALFPSFDLLCRSFHRTRLFFFRVMSLEMIV